MVQLGQELTLDDCTNFDLWWEAFNWSAIFIEPTDTLTWWSYLGVIEVNTCSKYIIIIKRSFSCLWYTIVLPFNPLPQNENQKEHVYTEFLDLSNKYQYFHRFPAEYCPVVYQTQSIGLWHSSSSPSLEQTTHSCSYTGKKIVNHFPKLSFYFQLGLLVLL